MMTGIMTVMIGRKLDNSNYKKWLFLFIINIVNSIFLWKKI